MRFQRRRGLGGRSQPEPSAADGSSGPDLETRSVYEVGPAPPAGSDPEAGTGPESTPGDKRAKPGPAGSELPGPYAPNRRDRGLPAWEALRHRIATESGRRRVAGRILRKRWLVSTATVLAALGVGYLIAAQLVFSSERDRPSDLVVLPNLVGVSGARAGEMVEEAGLRLETIGQLFHPEHEPGVVIGQIPLPGQLGDPETPVRVTLSLGPELVVLPDVSGLTEGQAEFVLRRLGIGTTTTTTASRWRRGQVIRTVPAPGARVGLPGEVQLVVSEGREVVAVPDLEGRHLDDVELLLQRIGLILGSVTYEPGNAGAPGRVIGQSPPADFALREGGAVSVRVAGRPEALDRPRPPDPGRPDDGVDGEVGDDQLLNGGR